MTFNLVDYARLIIRGVEKMVADKAYDSRALIDTIRDQGAQVVIPPRTTRILEGPEFYQ